MQITEPDELALLLGNVYAIEVKFERMIGWKIYLEFPEQARNLLFQLAHDSENHKKALTGMYEKFLNIDIVKYVNVDDELFETTGLSNKEIILKISHFDTLALDIYSKLNKYTNRKLLEKVFVFGNVEEYFNTLQWLIDEEKRHVSILNDFLVKNEF